MTVCKLCPFETVSAGMMPITSPSQSRLVSCRGTFGMALDEARGNHSKKDAYNTRVDIIHHSSMYGIQRTYSCSSIVPLEYIRLPVPSDADREARGDLDAKDACLNERNRTHDLRSGSTMAIRHGQSTVGPPCPPSSRPNRPGAPSTLFPHLPGAIPSRNTCSKRHAWLRKSRWCIKHPPPPPSIALDAPHPHGMASLQLQAFPRDIGPSWHRNLEHGAS